MGTIIVVEDINKLGDVIEQYDEISSRMGKEMSSNNVQFCVDFEKIVYDMMDRKRVASGDERVRMPNMIRHVMIK
jgi:hypothetical protein